MTAVHPDDEALSAALDGEDDEARAHAQTCPACAARLEQLAAVARAVAVPVSRPIGSASDAARKAAIAAALAAVAPEPASIRPPATAPVPAGAGASAGARSRDDIGTRGAREHTRTPTRTRRRTLTGNPGRALGVLSAAAAIILVVVGAVALSRTDTGSRKTSSASGAASSPTLGPNGAVVSGGDLGAINDGSVLAAAVAARLGVPGPPPGAAAAAGATSAGAASTAGTAAASSQLGNNKSASDQAAAGSNRSPSPATGPLPTDAVCVTEAQAAGAAQLGTLDFHATLRWQDQPAEVLGFQSNGPGLTHHLFVMGLNGCGLLAVQSF